MCPSVCTGEKSNVSGVLGRGNECGDVIVDGDGGMHGWFGPECGVVMIGL